MQLSRITLIFLILFAVNSFQNAHSYERASVVAPTSKKVRVGLFNAPPIVIVSDGEQPKGMMIDFINEIAASENWEIEWVRNDWPNLLKMAQKNQIDLVTFIAYSDERAQYLKFSKESFITGWGQVYTHNKNIFQSVIDFNNKTLAIVENEIHGISFKEQCKIFDVTCNYKVVQTYAQAFELLEQKEVDGTVSGNIVGLSYLQEYDIYPTSVLFNPKKSLFAAPQSKTAHLLNTIDRYLIKWRADKNSPYFKAYDKWLDPKQEFGIPQWLTFVFYAISFLLVAALLMTYYLRKQIQVKTDSLEMQRIQIRQIIDLIPHFIYAANNKDDIYLINQYAADYCGIEKGNYDTLSKSHLIEKYGASRSLFKGDDLILMNGFGNVQKGLETENSDGEKVYFNLTKVPFIDSVNKSPALIAVGVDVTDAKNHQQQIEHMSYHDPMTKLPNRILLNDRIKQSLALSFRQAHSGAVILIDFDDFKNVNHTYGQSIADTVLITMAERLQGILSVGDTVSRLSGDTFVVHLNELSKDQNKANDRAFAFSNEAQEEITRPIDNDDYTISVTASIGIVLYPFDGRNHINILPRAESSLRHAKASGKNQIVRFKSEMEVAIFEKHLILNELKSAIELEEFELYYQPQNKSNQPHPIGFEALIRWNHKKHGLVYPDEFIPSAEENNLINPIGYWVIEDALKRLSLWKDTRLDEAFISINLSVIQIKDHQLVPIVKNLIEKYTINPSLIEFEITETVLFGDIGTSIATLNLLKKLGVRLSIDDFGTGYSSLSYISQLPLDKLKIDRSFIKDLESDKGSQAIVKNIVRMGNDLGLEVLAEGVETKEHLKFLESIGCIFFQGYYFSKALSISDIKAYYNVLIFDETDPENNKLST